MKGISFEASEYIHACALVFKKTHAQILDEMVKACKKLKAVTLHDK
jgi:SHS2 domain-containing protein